jgi:hypothetical protein
MPIDRHRIERIGGDTICDSALTAAPIIDVFLRTNRLRGSHTKTVRQGLCLMPKALVW